MTPGSGSQSHRGRVALLVPTRARRNPAGDVRTAVGGADMRFESVREALSAHWDCLYVEARCGAPDSPHDGCGFRLADPASAWYYDSSYCPVFASALIEELRAAGVSHIVCSSLNVHRYIGELADGLDAKVIFDLHNIEGKLYAEMRSSMSPGDQYDRVLSDRNAEFVRAAEATAIARSDILWTCSEEDQAAVAHVYPEAVGKRTVYVADVVAVEPEPPEPHAIVRAIFTARLDYFPNVLAAETIFAEIAPDVPDLEFVVAGAQPHARLVEAHRSANAHLVADPPAMAGFFPGAVMLVPLTHGGGSRFKVIEAFALGSPVVSTHKGAEGLGADDDKHYLVAEDRAGFVSAIGRLRNDPQLRDSIVYAGWELALERHSIRSLAAQLADLD